jgi:polyhydroxybutyrate depolymerase
MSSRTTGADERFVPGLHAFTLEAGGELRSYLVYLPEHWTSTAPLPLVLVFHGRGGTALYAKAVTAFTDKADADRFLVVFPEAVRNDPSRPVHMHANPTLWNDGSPRRFPSRDKVDDVAFIAQLLDRLCETLPVDPRRIYATGFSNGGSLAFRLGIEMPQRLAAIAPVAANLWQRGRGPARPVPLVYLTGDDDPLNPVEGGEFLTPWGEMERKPPVHETVRLWARWIGCSEEPTVVQDDATVRVERFAHPEPCPTAAAEAWLFIARGVGHVWPGGRSVLTVDPSLRSLVATDIIWDQFRRFVSAG